MSMMREPILALDNVSKVFGRADRPVYAARSVSFALYPGRTLALVGESGSGKTTAARLIMREYAPDEGRLMFRGVPLGKADANALKAYRSAVQMVFQDPFSSLNPTHTIRYHVERPLKLLAHLHEGDVKAVAKSKNVPQQLATAARRLIAPPSGWLSSPKWSVRPTWRTVPPGKSSRPARSRPYADGGRTSQSPTRWPTGCRSRRVTVAATSR